MMLEGIENHFSRPLLQQELFADERCDFAFAPDAMLLPAFALPYETVLLEDLKNVLTQAPWRYWDTPGGYRMSAAKSNCGKRGWVSNRSSGYYYSTIDPETGNPWPVIPASFLEVARAAAAVASFPSFNPEGCLLNQYKPGSKLGLHQDRDESDLRSPIVTISLGIPATFLFGGMQRSDRTQKIQLFHGDVAVWGRQSRLAFHGIQTLKEGFHPALGAQRISVTFRQII